MCLGVFLPLLKKKKILKHLRWLISVNHSMPSLIVRHKMKWKLGNYPILFKIVASNMDNSKPQKDSKKFWNSWLT